jgi:alpha-L-arabinofuranosidase
MKVIYIALPDVISLVLTSIALGWVEYCNGTGNTYYANLRRKNGRDKPYNVSQKLKVLVR